MAAETLLLDGRTQSLIENYVPEGEILEGLVSFFSVFADQTRLRILSALAITELCVTDISLVLELNQTTVSHQLRFLKNIGIVKCSRVGKVIFYREIRFEEPCGRGQRLIASFPMQWLRQGRV